MKNDLKRVAPEGSSGHHQRKIVNVEAKFHSSLEKAEHQKVGLQSGTSGPGHRRKVSATAIALTK